ncbi:TPA: hypothetical protein ACGVAU_004440 [Vibrio vulnificus]|uniref:hypothetical protein n=1 Tax=Vibrio TaxID=662 RepID=UPI00162919A3|nr:MULTISPECIES: hypothetical protein [Vibrio]MCU8207761.1 hypothetical protein [Vibrio vulnificus]EGR2700622.1 hypothetical protein [Vibrio parahaemolyticus]EKH9212934.1 hypothetical protein [Vibrio parahaemolyticus]MBE3914881.1 hypothetical protein [Vibrio parahaemolyticus]MBT2925354.1 hypothetical protein [Vibrio anguillarum]
MSKGKNWDALGKVGQNAALTENKTDDKPVATTKAKHLKAVPTTYFEKHQELKDGGKTSLDFTAYIIEAIREKLERDGAL